jgi:hypothetical protein
VKINVDGNAFSIKLLSMSATSKQIRQLKLDCAVPGCPDKAVTAAPISINNAPKKCLPVCQCHADAAEEDLMDGRIQLT